MAVQIAFRKNDNRIFSLAIQAWTDSIYSHCEIVVDGMCYSSSMLDGGVRSKEINLDLTKWDVIDIDWADADFIIDYFIETDGHTYGILSLIRNQLFNRNMSIKERQFCSEWCANALRLPNAVSYSPASLYNVCVFLNEIYRKAPSH